MTPQISSRLDTAAVRAHLGAEVARFEKPSITQVIRVRPATALASAALSPQTPAFTSSWPSVPRAWARIPDRGSHHV